MARPSAPEKTAPLWNWPIGLPAWDTSQHPSITASAGTRLAGTQVERTYQLINAAYRGVQDARTAVRYFRMNAAEMDNEYGIDPDKIAMFGDGTGGYVTLASATLQDYNDIILNNAGEAIESFWYDPGDGSVIPMVIEAINGDPG